MSQELINQREPQSGFISSGKPIGTAISRNKGQFTANPGRLIATGNNSSAVVTVTAAPILAGNINRSYLFIQNLGANNVHISFGSSPSTVSPFPGTILIPPNGWYEQEFTVLTDTIYAIASAGTNSVTIVQGTWKRVYE